MRRDGAESADLIDWNERQRGPVTMRREQVAEQLDVEGVVLDNQDLGQPKRSPTLSRHDLSHAGALDK